MEMCNVVFFWLIFGVSKKPTVEQTDEVDDKERFSDVGRRKDGREQEEGAEKQRYRVQNTITEQQRR